jgi:class 3 adenylate cyclase
LPEGRCHSAESLSSCSLLQLKGKVAEATVYHHSSSSSILNSVDWTHAIPAFVTDEPQEPNKEELQPLPPGTPGSEGELSPATWLRFWLQAVLAASALTLLAGIVWVGMDNTQKAITSRVYHLLDDALARHQGGSQTWMRHNEAFQCAWREEFHKIHIQKGATMMFVVALMLLGYRALRLFKFPACLSPHYNVRIPELIIVALVSVAIAVCIKYPNDKVFWASYVLMGFYILASTLPPFQWSCRELEEYCGHEEASLYVKEAVEEFDCSLQGQTASLLFMTSLFATPWIIPEFSMMHLLWIHAGAYVIWTYLYAAIPGEGYHGSFDEVLVRGSLLLFMFFEAMCHKLQMERSEQKRFSTVLGVRHTTAVMYGALANMLPKHVIKPRLKDPDSPFSSLINRASVMFVLVDGFDNLNRTSFTSAKDCIKFLNYLFTRLDQICETHGVTKIESVCEEYVCCVGVTPEDEAEAKHGGHSKILGRLIAAAQEMLKLPVLQSPKVQLRMGIHTGPLIAGIIGKRLPRYRLFGDTINTAARMMQKCPSGRLQFGRETRGDLPDSIQVEDRGLVEMKGKGEVQVYTLISSDPEEDDDEEEALCRPGAVTRFLADDFSGAEEDEEESPLRCLINFDVNESSAPDEIKGSASSQAVQAAVSACNKARSSSSPSEEILKEVMEMDMEDVRTSGGGWSIRQTLRELHSFDDEMERQWDLAFHQNSPGTDCSRIISNFNLLTMGIVLLTAIDLSILLASGNRLFHMDHELFTWHWRLPIYLGCRVTAATTLLALKFVCRRPWFQDEPSWGQFYILTSLMVVAILMFVSYDSLTESRGAVADLGKQLGPVDNLHRHWAAYAEALKNVQLFPLFFVLFYFRLVRAHSPLFKHSLIFVPLALAITAYTITSPSNHLYLTWWGSNLFIVNAILTCLVAYEEETISRMEFRSKRSIEDSQNRVQGMLDSLMPPLIVEEIRRSKLDSLKNITHPYEHATIAQSDLCGFTQLSSTCTPAQVVAFISDLFGRFDEVAEEYGIYKVETVGDAYQAGMAEKPLTPERSPSRVVLFGVAMVRVVTEWSKSRGLNVKCRVGVHDSSCVGGIVGVKMQRYHLFGEIMGVLDTLEATAPEGGVQVSSACKRQVDEELAIPGNKAKLLLQEPSFGFRQRSLPVLRTSKGEEHSFDEVGGPTFVVEGPIGLRGGD